jgi:hypothetical protein
MTRRKRHRRRAEAYFTRLLHEIRAKAASTVKTGYTVRTAEIVVESIQKLRYELAREQETRQFSIRYHEQTQRRRTRRA